MLEKNGLTIFTNSQPHKLFKRITQKILMNNPNYHIPNKNSGSERIRILILFNTSYYILFK